MKFQCKIFKDGICNDSTGLSVKCCGLCSNLEECFEENKLLGVANFKHCKLEHETVFCPKIREEIMIHGYKNIRKETFVFR